MATCVRPQCSSLTALSLTMRPNPDISGVGVLVGSLGTAYMTLILVVIHYVIDCGAHPATNAIDRGIIDFLQSKFGQGSKTKWTYTLRKGVLMFSDQQIVTGIALLAAGYSQLHCGLSAYHWEIVVDLVWFSSLTHLTTLTVLYQYFRDNPLVRNWRAASMLAIVVMLGIALLSMGNVSSANMAVPAQCLFEKLVDEDGPYAYSDPLAPPSMIISIIILFISYVTRLIKLSKMSSVFARRWLRSKPGHLLKGWLDGLNRRSRLSRAGFLYTIGHQLLLTVFVLLRALLDVYESMLWEILWLAYALAWGTIRLFVTRKKVHSYRYNDKLASEEDFWSFGQSVSVALLMLPILAMAEMFFGKCSLEGIHTIIFQIWTAQIHKCLEVLLLSYLVNVTRVFGITYSEESLFDDDSNSYKGDLRDSSSKETDDNLSSTQGSVHTVSCRTRTLPNDHGSDEAPIQNLSAGPDIAFASVPRTSTGLPLMGESLGSHDHPRPVPTTLRSNLTGSTSLSVDSFIAEPSSIQAGNMSYNRDFYQYTWFRSLIFLIHIFILEFIVWLLIFTAKTGSVVRTLTSVTRSAASIIVWLPAYVLLFLCLEDFHRPISSFLLVLRIPRAAQHTIHLYLPYMAFFALNIGFVILSRSAFVGKKKNS